ncbi:MAG TPA: hypothetical protein VL383_16910, partial [Gemmatimonadaceae bacterium]|nr:hypothetical protein [Gemmatimonadaceae bacterium]
ELGTAARAGSLAGAFLLVQSLAGVRGPSIVGYWFDVAGSKRALFVLLAMFLAGAFALMATLAPGFGEAEKRSSAARRGEGVGNVPSPLFGAE